VRRHVSKPQRKCFKANALLLRMPPKKAELYTGDPESKVVEKGIKVVWL
jgi:hypothetical protein